MSEVTTQFNGELNNNTGQLFLNNIALRSYKLYTTGQQSFIAN